MTPERRLTYGALDREVRAAASAFIADGIGEDARVLLSLDDDLELAVLFLASLAVGAVPAILSPHQDVTNLSGVIERCDPSAVFVFPGDEPRVAAGAPLLAGDARRSAATRKCFADVACTSWVSGRTVLLGNAAHGTHFSIGSGTRLAICVARELAAQVAAMDGFDRKLLKAYERTRKAEAASLHDAALRSMSWFENPPLALAVDDIDTFAYSLVARSGRIGRAEIRKLDPAFLARIKAASPA